MKVKVFTKSNFKNLNNEWLEVKEICGKRVSCQVPTPFVGIVTTDFTLSEVLEMQYP